MARSALRQAFDRWREAFGLRKKKRSFEDEPIPMSVVAKLSNFGPWADEFACPACKQRYQTLDKTGPLIETFACWRCGEVFRPPLP